MTDRDIRLTFNDLRWARDEVDLRSAEIAEAQSYEDYHCMKARWEMRRMAAGIGNKRARQAIKDALDERGSWQRLPRRDHPGNAKQEQAA